MTDEPDTFIDVIQRDSCRFIGGKIEKPIYCGNKRIDRTAWCAEHRAVVYTKQRGRADGQA